MNDFMQNAFIYFLVTIVVLVVIFLILREVNCWYWKINERIKLQKRNNDLLELLLVKLNTKDNEVQGNTNFQISHCPECKCEIINLTEVCPHCGYPIAKNKK